MSEIIFLYNGQEIAIQCNNNEKFNSIIDKFCQKSKLSKNNIYFLFGGKILDEQIDESQIPKNENDKKFIIVYDIERTKVKENVIIKSSEIICPKCKESACISIKDTQISLFQCCNGHNVDNISFDEFDESQKVNISKIICDNCRVKNKGNANNNEFFRCINCKLNLCPLCRAVHNINHSIINYDYKNCICETHGEPFISFCKQCKKDICMSCDEEHENHEIDFYQKIKCNKEQLKHGIINIKNNIEQINNLINEFIQKFNKVKKILEKYYEIIDIIYKTSDSKYRNYNKLFNINSVINNSFNKDIQNIINEKDINNKITKILKICESKKKDSINIQNKDNNSNKHFEKIPTKTNDKNNSQIRENKSMKELCDELLRNKEVTSQKVISVMIQIDRADFVQKDYYKNRAQHIICNTTISAPHLHGYCLEHLQDYLKEGNTVLDIGFGSGYLTVAMSKMMNDKGLVVGIEHIKDLYDYGENNISKHHKNLLDNKKIELFLGDGRKGLINRAPYDCIHVGAASNVFPLELFKQLKVGGRLLIPIGPAGNQYIYFIDKVSETEYKTTKGWSVNYVPLTSVENQMNYKLK